METSKTIQIPKCELCKTPFSATMKIGVRKIDNTLLVNKFKKVSYTAWFEGLIMSIGSLTSLVLIILGVLNLLTGKCLIFTSVWSLMWSALKTSFVSFIIPVSFINNSLKKLKKKWKLVEECKVQLVVVTLLPTKILNH